MKLKVGSNLHLAHIGWKLGFLGRWKLKHNIDFREKKVNAIKYVSSKTGVGLKEAKAYVDSKFLPNPYYRVTEEPTISDPESDQVDVEFEKDKASTLGDLIQDQMGASEVGDTEELSADFGEVEMVEVDEDGCEVEDDVADLFGEEDADEGSAA